MLDLEDPLMRTIDTRYYEPNSDDVLLSTEDGDSDTLANLEGAISSKMNESLRVRRLSLSTLVIDLALAVRRSLGKLHVVG